MFQRLFALIGYVHESEVAKAVKRVNEYRAGSTSQQTELAALFNIYKDLAFRFLNESDYDWRSLKAIRTELGFDKDDCDFVRIVLRAAGARPSYGNKNLYGLKSRVGESGRRSRSY